MSKLLKLKKWLTIGEASNMLSSLTGEDVSSSDIYHLALYSGLQLSISIEESSFAERYSYICNVEEVEHFRDELLGNERMSWVGLGFVLEFDRCVVKYETEIIACFGDIETFKLEYAENAEICLNKLTYNFPIDKYLLRGSCLFVDDKVYQRDLGKMLKVTGVFDLVMIGNEALDIKSLMHQGKGMIGAELLNIDGFFVKDGNAIYNLQTSSGEGCNEEELLYPASGINDLGAANFVCRTKCLLDFE